MAGDADDQNCRATAYHESGHIVIACALGLRVSPKGIRIDNFAAGRAWFSGSTDGTPVPASDVDAVVLALFAGGLVSESIEGYRESANEGDEARIRELLEAHSAPNTLSARYKELRARASEMVKTHWSAIENVADSLWGQPWVSPPHRLWPKEKALSANSLLPLIAPIAVAIDEFAE